MHCEMAYASEALQSAFDPLVRSAHTARVEKKRPAAVLMARLARYQKEFSLSLIHICRRIEPDDIHIMKRRAEG